MIQHYFLFQFVSGTFANYMKLAAEVGAEVKAQVTRQISRLSFKLETDIPRDGVL